MQLPKYPVRLAVETFFPGKKFFLEMATFVATHYFCLSRHFSLCVEILQIVVRRIPVQHTVLCRTPLAPCMPSPRCARTLCATCADVQLFQNFGCTRMLVKSRSFSWTHLQFVVQRFFGEHTLCNRMTSSNRLQVHGLCAKPGRDLLGGYPETKLCPEPIPKFLLHGNYFCAGHRCIS